MNDRSLLTRITSNPSVLSGKPTVRGTRLSVEFLLNLLAHGATETEILSEYERLVPEDFAACFLFASKSLGNTTSMPLAGEYLNSVGILQVSDGERAELPSAMVLPVSLPNS